MAPDERRGPNGRLRARLGLVLLDLGHGIGRPVELERRHAGGHLTAEDLDQRFQLYDRCGRFCRFERDLLSGEWSFEGGKG